MNKLKFNNLVISNKKAIQQARAQTIRKCVQKLRKLKNLLEKQPEQQKHKDTLQRTVMLVDYLKKLKSFQIIKGVLLLDKKPTAVLTNVRSSMEEVANAMLCTNKIIQTLILRIKTELQLRENDASWRKQLQEVSRRRAKQVRTEDKRRRRQEEKSQKLLSRNRQTWLEEHRTDDEQLNEEKRISTNGVWKEEAAEDAETKHIKVEASSRKKSKAQKPVKTNQAKNLRISEKVSAAKVQIQPKIETAVEVESTENVKQIVDSFFITETGDNYLSTIVSINAEQKNNEETLQEEPSIVNFSRKRNRDNQFKNKWEGNNTNQYQRPQQSFGNMDNKLHPSWAAKQKLLSTVRFQGKKIKFDENSTEEKQNKSTIPAKQNSSTQELHPSWAAKQKLKPVITAFQGKKIVFDA